MIALAPVELRPRVDLRNRGTHNLEFAARASHNRNKEGAQWFPVSGFGAREHKLLKSDAYNASDAGSTAQRTPPSGARGSVCTCKAARVADM